MAIIVVNQDFQCWRNTNLKGISNWLSLLKIENCNVFAKIYGANAMWHCQQLDCVSSFPMVCLYDGGLPSVALYMSEYLYKRHLCGFLFKTC